MTDYSDGLYEISKALCLLDPESQHHGVLGGEYGYGQNYKNEIFEMRPYHWGDCTCSFDDDRDKWDEENTHKKDCYQTFFDSLHYEDDEEYWKKEKEGHRGIDGPCDCVEVAREKFGIDPELPGGFVHCTCDYMQRWEEFLATNFHSNECPIDKPNFKHYESQLEITWYKYIGRGMEYNMELDFRDWAKIATECLDSIKGASNE